MIFEVSDQYVHEGDTFDLSCTMSGDPSNFSRIIAEQTGQLMPNQIQKRVNSSATRTYVPVFQPVGEVYICEGESYFAGQLVVQLRKEVTVHVYGEAKILLATYSYA